MNIQNLASLYKVFSAEEWNSLGVATNLNLNEAEINNLKSLGDPIDIREVEHIYLPLIRLLNYVVQHYKNYYLVQEKFFQSKITKIPPFIIGIAGSVAVGKSTMARILQILLTRSIENRKVDLITTDGFLYNNDTLANKNKMHRKGFPDSYNIFALLQFLLDVKNLKTNIKAPTYSHSEYDVLTDKWQIVNQPEILIVEGVNVLQIYNSKKENQELPFVSDFFDFSIYIDAKIDNIEKWYINRFMKLRATDFTKDGAYFKKYTQLSDEESLNKAKFLWKTINLKNLKENIAPSKRRANLIFYKGDNHLIEKIAFRN